MTTLSLLRCVGCGFVTGDAVESFRDDEPRCPPCERRADHQRRLEQGDRWYADRIVAYAEGMYGADWEQQHGWRYCADLFADARALGGWAAVGVELGPRRARLEVTTEPCPVCGETTTSVTGFFCAGCHFAGWWGRWRDDNEGTPAA